MITHSLFTVSAIEPKQDESQTHYCYDLQRGWLPCFDCYCLFHTCIEMVYSVCRRLGLHLPHKVDSSKSKAKWISDKDTLEVTLRITREYDSLNQ